MANYTRIEVTAALKRMGAVPVFYDSNIEVCKEVIKACYDGGGRVFEFTNRGDFASEVFGELSQYVTANLPGMIIGIGSVVEPTTAGIYLQLGANFVVSPILNPEMAKVCNRRKIMWIPGCGSVSEISFAEELGAEVVKIFPAVPLGGPSFVKALKSPLPWSSIMATGGVKSSRESLKEWFEAGVDCVGLGSDLFSKKSDGTYDYAAIKDKVESILQTIKELKS